MLPTIRGIRKKTIKEMRHYAAVAILSSHEKETTDLVGDPVEFAFNKGDIQSVYDAVGLATNGTKYFVDVYERARDLLVAAIPGTKSQLEWAEQNEVNSSQYWQDCINMINRLLEYLNQNLS